ncbi:MAG: efflux transporter outer membrane subunit [Rhodospirillaceae bacterium]
MRSFSRSVSAVSLIAIALSACAGYPPAKVEVPGTFDAASSFDAAAAAAPAPDKEWWSRFGNAELSQLVAEARANNHDLKATVARILQAEAQSFAAQGALLPSLDAGVSASRSERQGQTLDTDGNVVGTNRVTTSYGANLRASYQLDIFGQQRNSADAANQRFESSLYNGVTVEITLISNTVTTYLQALSARERLELAERRLKNAETILQLLETQRRIGTISDLELAQQRSAIANQRATIPALRLSERQSLNALAVLVGRAPEGFTITGRTLADVKLPDVGAGIPSDLLERRPDLRTAEANLKAANFDLAASKAARLPSFSLTAQGGSSSNLMSELLNPGTFFWSLGGSAAQTLFAGGRLYNQERGAKANYRALLETYRQSVLNALRDTENALTAVSENGRQYTLAQEAYAQAEYAYKLAELRYRAGAEPFQTMLTAQNNVFQTQESVVQSGLTRFTAVIGLTQALGGGWDGVTPEAPPMALLKTPVE